MTPGEHIGPYLIEALLGEGGMGEVYRARDTRLDRTVALKVSKSEFGERFISEAKAIAAFNHPNICTLFDVGPNYLVMEHIEGTPLKGPLSAEKAVAYAGQILDALDAAHRKGFTHRDLKPANILVTKQGIKLLDFGLAKQKGPLGQSDATLTQALTEAGQIVGTLQYMSPEQLQGKEADARSDLFAFGCVLYEMLSGKRAFEGASAASVIAAILEREPAPLDLHPPLGRVIAKCLAKDPDNRFQNALDLKTALGWAMEQQPVSVAKANRWPWALAAAVVITGLGTWTVMRSTKSPVDEQAVRLQLNPPEGGRIDPASLAVSADGRMFAYAATVQGKRGLWVRSLDGVSARPLPGTEGALLPFWSPDGRSIGYAANNKIWRINLAGGAPLAVCDVPGGTFRGAAWGADGMIVFGTPNGPLKRVSAFGGTPTPLTALNSTRGESTHVWPQILPGGRTVLFFVWAAKPEDTGIYAARLNKPAGAIRVAAASSNGVFSAGHVLWRRGSTVVAQRFDPDRLELSGVLRPVTDSVSGGVPSQLALAASAGGVLLFGSSGNLQQLTWFDRAGKAAGTVGPAGHYADFALSMDGRRVAASKFNEAGADIWMVDVDRDVSSRLTFTPSFKHAAVWSPDGLSIVFYSGSPPNLFRKDASGAGVEERITESGSFQAANDWSRDGRSLLYHSNVPGTNRDLWVLPVKPDGKPEDGAKPRPYLRTPFNEMLGRFSPEANPRWVAYQSDESGRVEIYVQAYPEPKGKFLVSNGGGTYPMWGPDGREIFYLAPDSKLMSVKLKVGTEAVTPSAPTALFEVTDLRGGSRLAVSPDGRRFLVKVPADKGAQPVEVILNWPALLKKGGE